MGEPGKRLIEKESEHNSCSVKVDKSQEKKEDINHSACCCQSSRGKAEKNEQSEWEGNHSVT